MKVEVMSCLTAYASHVVQTVRYKNWSDKFCRKQINEYTEGFVSALADHIDWDNLSREDALELGFRLWDKDRSDLYLIPLYLLPILPIGTEVTCINGNKVVYDGVNIDDDIRFGCLAYGISIKE